MSVIHQGEVEQPIRAPGETIEFSNSGQAAVSRVTTHCVWARVLQLRPTIGSAHPDFSTFQAVHVLITREEGNVGRIETTYEGPNVGPGGAPNIPAPTYSLESSVSAEPVELNPRYEDVTDDELRRIREALKDDTAPTGLSPLATELYQKKLYGQDSYLRPAAVFVVSYQSRTAPNPDRVGKIASPPGPNPTLGEGQNWLYAALTWEARGGLYSVQERYQASGPGGWDPDLYER